MNVLAVKNQGRAKLFDRAEKNHEHHILPILGEGGGYDGRKGVVGEQVTLRMSSGFEGTFPSQIL